MISKCKWRYRCLQNKCVVIVVNCCYSISCSTTTNNKNTVFVQTPVSNPWQSRTWPRALCWRKTSNSVLDQSDEGQGRVIVFITTLTIPTITFQWRCWSMVTVLLLKHCPLFVVVIVIMVIITTTTIKGQCFNNNTVMMDSALCLVWSLFVCLPCDSVLFVGLLVVC